MSEQRRGSFTRLPMRPQGTQGRLFGVLMERLNEPAYRAALRHLEPRPGERFLEIGFGTGRLVELLLEAAEGVEVSGVDPTPTMLEVARGRKALAAAGPRADLRLGSDVPLPFETARFDGAAALHAFQFWPRPDASLRELHRVLRPGGRLVLVFREHGQRAPGWLPNPLSRSGAEVEKAGELLAESGFAAEEMPPVGRSRVLLARRQGG